MSEYIRPQGLIRYKARTWCARVPCLSLFHPSSPLLLLAAHRTTITYVVFTARVHTGRARDEFHIRACTYIHVYICAAHTRDNKYPSSESASARLIFHSRS